MNLPVRLPIRVRLSLWYGISLAIVLGVLMIAGFAYFRNDQRAEAAAELSRQCLELDRGFRAELAELLAGQGANSAAADAAQQGEIDLKRVAAETLLEYGPENAYAEFLELRAGRWTLLAESQRGWRPPVPPRPPEIGQAASQLPGETEALRLPGAMGLARRIDNAVAGRFLFTAVIGSTAPLERSLGALRHAFFLFGFAGLLVAAVGGHILSRAALAPIDALTRRASDLAESGGALAGQSLLPVENEGDEVGRLAMTLNHLLRSVDASIRLMRGFVADAAHELRTPVSVVRAEAELALSKPRTGREYEQSLRGIAAEAVHLSRLVSDLTLLAEGQDLSAPLELRACDVPEIIHEVVKSLEPVARARRIEIGQRGLSSAIVDGDPDLIRRIFVNLIDNAIKFSPPGSAIEACVECRGSTVEICVSDAAPTIGAADRNRIFERFYRTASARAGGIEGSGLGLAIVRWAVDLHRGKITVEPRSPAGNLFRVSL